MAKSGRNATRQSKPAEEPTPALLLTDLLRCATELVGRIAVPYERAKELLEKNTTPKQIKAFNLCDGTRSQAEVVKAAGLDQGNFSRATTRWIENGLMFRLGSGRDARLLHVYSVPAADFVKPRKRAGSRRKRGGR